MAELPSGTVTFLFTDIEGSTRLWEEHPETMRTALARHDDILRGAIGEHSGAVFSTGGDGVAAAFVRAADALRAALQIQIAVFNEAWPDATPIRVRIGLHTGEVEEREGDYFGPAVNRSARLMAIGHGGQILVSGATEALVRDGLSEEAGLVDLGEHRLRDLSEPLRVFQVQHPDLRDRFPPLRSLDALPGNLPQQVTRLIGRVDDLAHVAEALVERRVVTLTGVGGVGKTRLALQVAADVLPRFREGAWLVELAPVRDPEEVTSAVAAVLGVSPHRGLNLEESLVEFLRTKQLLLVIDNCEHLLDAVGDLVETLVQACPGVVILATSREGLALHGEQILAVPSLEAPPASADLDAVAKCDAVALFLQRAQLVDADFILTAQNAIDVAQVCRRLDGVPLAIELAAARVRAMSPAELARGLDHRFETLAGGRRRAIERHQTLRATIDWSYDLLSEPERYLLGRLSVFAGGWTREAAEAICGSQPIGSREVFDLLVSLVDRSLVVAQRHADHTRYRLLETIREYGEERLAQHAETERLRDRHAEHYAEFLGRTSVEIYGPQENKAVKELIAEQENLIAAMNHAIDTRQADLAMRLLPDPSALTQLGDAFRVLTESLLALPGATDHPRYPYALALAATRAAVRGSFDMAMARCQEAAAAAERLGDPDHRAEHEIQMTQVSIAISQGAHALAAAHLERVIEINRSTGQIARASMVLSMASIQLALAGDAAGAITLATEGLALARQVGMPNALISNLTALAGGLANQDPERAKVLLWESIGMRTAPGYENQNWVGPVQAIWVAAHLEDWSAVLELSPRVLNLLNRARVTPVDIMNFVARALVRSNAEAAAVLLGMARRGLASAAVKASDLVPGDPAPPRANIGQFAELHRETTTMLIAALGETRMGELRAQGEAMDDDQAIAYTIDAIAKAQAALSQ